MGLKIESDGLITLSGSSGLSTQGTANFVINEDGSDAVDFRVESAGEDEAIFLDSGANHLSINSGETAFTTTIHNDVGEAITVTGTEVVINDDGNTAIDFRVQTLGEDEAILLDSSANTLYINKGGTSFTTIIKNINEECVRFGAGGIIFNEYKNRFIDFRVESENKDHAFYIDSDNDKILFLSGGNPDTSNTSPSNICFFVSGAYDANNQGNSVAEAAFGGDLSVSGSLKVARLIYNPGGQVFAGGNYHFGTSKFNVSFTPGDNSSNDDFLVGTHHNDYGIFVDASTDRVLILSGGASWEKNWGAASDVSFYVSGSHSFFEGNETGFGAAGGVINLAGDTHVSGNFRVSAEFPSEGGYWNETGMMAQFGPWASGEDGASHQEDVIFYVSGAIGSHAGGLPEGSYSTALFGGDLVCSGGLYYSGSAGGISRSGGFVMMNEQGYTYSHVSNIYVRGQPSSFMGAWTTSEVGNGSSLTVDNALAGPSGASFVAPAACKVTGVRGWIKCGSGADVMTAKIYKVTPSNASVATTDEATATAIGSGAAASAAVNGSMYTVSETITTGNTLAAGDAIFLAWAANGTSTQKNYFSVTVTGEWT